MVDLKGSFGSLSKDGVFNNKPSVPADTGLWSGDVFSSVQEPLKKNSFLRALEDASQVSPWCFWTDNG